MFEFPEDAIAWRERIKVAVCNDPVIAALAVRIGSSVKRDDRDESVLGILGAAILASEELRRLRPQRPAAAHIGTPINQRDGKHDPVYGNDSREYGEKG